MQGGFHISFTHHPVYIGPMEIHLPDFVKKYRKVIFLVDENTHIHCLPLVFELLNVDSCDLIEIESGEENKNLATCTGIWETLQDYNVEKNDLLINTGGGMISDIGGFAAATYKRGIPFIHIPTTLLAQVDASLGGKTGIDMGHVKNAIGTISFPEAVFIDPVFLETLGERHVRSGLAEVIKHALIADKQHFSVCKNLDHSPGAGTYENRLDLIRASAAIKLRILEEDPYEKSSRKLLNFGHTFGHAFESLSLEKGKETLLHGEAVAAGMICETYLSNRVAGLAESEMETVIAFLKEQFKPRPVGAEDQERLFRFMQQDKKNQDGRINCTLIRTIGKGITDQYISADQVSLALDHYNKIANG